MPARDEPPYGWQLAAGDLIADPVEHLVIARMRAWHSEGLSYSGIARRLNADGTTARGGRWSARAVAAVLEG